MAGNEEVGQWRSNGRCPSHFAIAFARGSYWRAMIEAAAESDLGRPRTCG